MEGAVYGSNHVKTFWLMQFSDISFTWYFEYNIYTCTNNSILDCFTDFDKEGKWVIFSLGKVHLPVGVGDNLTNVKAIRTVPTPIL